MRERNLVGFLRSRFAGSQMFHGGCSPTGAPNANGPNCISAWVGIYYGSDMIESDPHRYAKKFFDMETEGEITHLNDSHKTEDAIALIEKRWNYLETPVFEGSEAYWDNKAEGRLNPVFRDAEGNVLKALEPGNMERAVDPRDPDAKGGETW